MVQDADVDDVTEDAEEGDDGQHEGLEVEWEDDVFVVSCFCSRVVEDIVRSR